MRSSTADPVAGPAAPLLISFTTHPDQGSEAGVGWAFLRAAIQRTPEHLPVHLLFDARDHEAVRSGLQRAGQQERVRLHPVEVPAVLLQRYGDARTRQSYLGWVPVARRRLRRLQREQVFSSVHQVTFASAVLPAVMDRRTRGLRVWGPLAIPSAPTATRDRPARARDRVAVRLAQRFAMRNIRVADLVVANNAHTAELIRAVGRRVAVEPNIVAERMPAAAEFDADRLVMAGHLIDRKRPWLAVEALADPLLDGLRLEVLGDGVLMGDLRRLADDLGITERVGFPGAVPRDEAIARMSSARLLVHPSAREGSPWVVGEAAAAGVAAVVMRGSGAEATVELSGNGGVVAPAADAGDEARALALGVAEALTRPRPRPTDRWSALRLPALLDEWYRDPQR